MKNVINIIDETIVNLQIATYLYSKTMTNFFIASFDL